MDEKELAKQVLEKVNAASGGKYRIVAIFMAIILLIVTGYFWFKYSQNEELRLQHAKVMSEQYTRDVNALQNELKMSKQNAEFLAAFVARAQAGQVQPVTHFTVTAPTLPAAADNVAERINQRDATLPPAALEKTDKTVVTLNEQQYKVDVYKHNGYKKWEWSVGIGKHGGDKYVPVELQHNFSKNAAVSYEQHFCGKETGWEVKYTRKTDKFLFLF